MNKEDIRNLIGGYATGSLTEDERRKLFEAALDDQDLFNALQDEQALKNLLDDPIARELVRRAAAESLPLHRNRWFAHPWIWAAGLSAVAAAVVLVAVVPSLQPRYSAKVAVLAKKASPPPPELVEPRLEAPAIRPAPAGRDMPKPQAAKRERFEEPPEAPAARDKNVATLASSTPPSAPSPQQIPFPQPLPAQQADLQPPAPVQFAPRQPQRADVVPGQQSAPPPPEKDVLKETRQFEESQKVTNSTEGLRTARALKKAAPVTPMGMTGAVAFRSAGVYSISKKLEDGTYVSVPTDSIFRPGDTIRLTVFPPVSGRLSVLERDSSGTETQLFPSPSAEAVDVRAREKYAVPLDITVKQGERLRITAGSTSTDVYIRTAP